MNRHLKKLNRSRERFNRMYGVEESTMGDSQESTGLKLHHLPTDIDVTLDSLLNAREDARENFNKALAFAFSCDDLVKREEIFKEKINIPPDTLNEYLRQNVTSGDTDVVSLLLCAGANPYSLGENGYPAFFDAIESNHPDIVELLMVNTLKTTGDMEPQKQFLKLLNINDVSDDSGSFFNYAVEKVGTLDRIFGSSTRVRAEERENRKNIARRARGIIDMILDFADKHLDAKNCLTMLNAKDSGSGETVLMYAIKNNDTKFVNNLLNFSKRKLDTEQLKEFVNAKNKAGDAALIFAVSDGYPNIVDALIQDGADVDAKNNHDFTALMYAAMNSRTVIVQKLINAGANVDAKTKYGHTPLNFAENQEIINLLLENQKDK